MEGIRLSFKWHSLPIGITIIHPTMSPMEFLTMGTAHGTTRIGDETTFLFKKKKKQLWPGSLFTKKTPPNEVYCLSRIIH